MADDWRLVVTLRDSRRAHRLAEALHDMEIAHEARARLGERVTVSREGATVFLYADSERGGREAQAIVEAALAGGDPPTRPVRLERWHHVEERWEDAAVPLPTDAEGLRMERERREAQDEEESGDVGAQWEVRLELSGHAETRDLAERLEAEGISVVRRWRHLVVGAPSEEDARALADRLRAEAPPGTRVEVEGSGVSVWAARPSNPFVFFGGLGV